MVADPFDPSIYTRPVKCSCGQQADYGIIVSKGPTTEVGAFKMHGACAFHVNQLGETKYRHKWDTLKGQWVREDSRYLVAPSPPLNAWWEDTNEVVRTIYGASETQQLIERLPPPTLPIPVESIDYIMDYKTITPSGKVRMPARVKKIVEKEEEERLKQAWRQRAIPSPTPAPDPAPKPPPAMCDRCMMVAAIYKTKTDRQVCGSHLLTISPGVLIYRLMRGRWEGPDMVAMDQVEEFWRKKRYESERREEERGQAEAKAMSVIRAMSPSQPPWFPGEPAPDPVPAEEKTKEAPFVPYFDLDF